MANLASTWQQQHRLDEAEKMRVQVLDLQKEMLGEKHPDTIKAMKSLASTWWEQGRLEQANQLQCYMESLRHTFKEFSGSSGNLRTH